MGTIHTKRHISPSWSALVVALTMALPAGAADITVTTTADELAVNGECSLREAIINANNNNQSGSTDCAAGTGSDTIILGAGTYTLSIAGRSEDAALSGDLDITELTTSGDLTIFGATDVNGGPASVIDANGIDRAFDIFNPAEKANLDTAFDGVTVTLRNLAMTNGLADESGSVAAGNQASGGAVFSWRFNNLTITNCRFDNNAAVWDGNIDDAGTPGVDERTLSGHGGAVYSRGGLTVNNSVFTNNTAYTTDDKNLDGIIEGEDEKSGNGGGLFVAFTSTVQNSTFSNNIASNGGGLNTTGGFTITIRGCTFNDNWAVMGGGVNNVSPSAPLIIENTTVSGNASTDLGAGINSDGSVSLTHVTVANNRLSDSDNKGAGINYFGPNGAFQLTNTLLTNNFGKSEELNCGCTGGATVTCSDLQVNSDGGNLSSDFNCGLYTSRGDLVGADPRLLALADNGGPTWTHALDYDSVALDAAKEANCLSTDQRAITRLAGVGVYIDGNGDGNGGCDIGAYERRARNTDLQLVLDADSTSLTTGDQVIVTVDTTNSGLLGINDARVVIALPAELSLQSASVVGGNDCNASFTTVSCELGDLLAGQINTIQLVAIAIDDGTVGVSATISALEVDSDVTNNSDGLTLTIAPASTTTTSSSGGGGGGCTPVGTGAARTDPLLPALIPLFLVVTAKRARKMSR